MGATHGPRVFLPCRVGATHGPRVFFICQGGPITSDYTLRTESVWPHRIPHSQFAFSFYQNEVIRNYGFVSGPTAI